MSAYIGIIKIRFQVLLQYRLAAFAGIFTQIFFGIVKIMIYDAFFTLSNVSGTLPMSFSQMVSYIWLGQAFLGMLPWNADSEIQSMIRSGNIVYELSRPLNLYNHWYCRLLAMRVASTSMRCLPVLIIAYFIMPQKYALNLPASKEGFIACIILLVGSLLLGCGISNIINITTIWSISGEGISRLIPAVVMIFSGLTIPLPLFPDWIQGFINFLPFRGLIDIPYRFYLGHIPASQLGIYSLHQICWILFFAIIGKWILNNNLKKIIIQGG